FFYYAYSCAILSFFFFSSRRRHTRSKRDWSSDVSLPICSNLIKIANVNTVCSHCSTPLFSVDMQNDTRDEDAETRACPVHALEQIGRASCRESGLILVVVVS